MFLGIVAVVIFFQKKDSDLPLKFTVPCLNSPTLILFRGGVYNKTNILCHFLFNKETIRNRQNKKIRNTCLLLYSVGNICSAIG